jgi:hypothetical protein
MMNQTDTVFKSKSLWSVKWHRQLFKQRLYK